MRSTTFLGMAALLALAASASAGPWADTVVDYAWANGEAGYDDPSAALGPPERITGEGTWPAQVEPFNGVWLPSEVVSMGPTGYLIVGFSAPVWNQRGDGIAADLIVFGNAFFTNAETDWAKPPRCKNPAAIFDNPGKIEVSQNGTAWFEVPGVMSDGLFPTLGYVDATPGSADPGAVPTDFRRPMPAGLTLADFNGKAFSEVAALYGTSGGGAAVDIGQAVTGAGDPAGLDWIRYVRISVPAGESYTTEIDAFAVVPEPATVGLVGLGLAGLWMRRREARRRRDACLAAYPREATEVETAEGSAMRLAKCLVSVVLAALVAAPAAASPILVGSGPNKANVLMNFGDGAAYQFDVSFGAEPVTGLDLIDTLEAAGIGFSTTRIFGGLYLSQFSYGGHSNTDAWSSSTPGAYWHYWVKDDPAADWTYSYVGASDRNVYNGYWDGWVYGSDAEPVPEPATLALVALGAAAALARRPRAQR